LQRQRSFVPALSAMPKADLGIVVVIPCFAEPRLWQSLQALAQCAATPCHAEVLVVVNYPELATQQDIDLCHKNLGEVIRAEAELSKPGLTFSCIKKFNLPDKNSGVGVARKYGMDEAAYRFGQVNNPGGIVACFDADATCDAHYLRELHALFTRNKRVEACSVYYEHPIQGNDFSKEIYLGIARYELHLRYYNQACKYANLPYAYHTVGSSMACTAEAYARVGGMPKNKAGEDFYFLQKLIPNGHFAELNTTRVIPSPRISHRVPFGTGRAIQEMHERDDFSLLTYRLPAFEVVKKMVEQSLQLFKADEKQLAAAYSGLPKEFTQVITVDEYLSAIMNAGQNAATQTMFERRFYAWFSAFRLMRYLNDAHASGVYAKTPVEQEAAELLQKLGCFGVLPDVFQLLNTYRRIERIS
jgi:hypothetical protein